MHAPTQVTTYATELVPGIAKFPDSLLLCHVGSMVASSLDFEETS